MLFSSTVAIFLIAWTSLFLLDYVLRLMHFVPYVEFATKHGLEISMFQLRIYTSRSDLPSHPAYKSSDKSALRCLQYCWFAIGAVTAVLSTVIVTGYLAYLVFHEISVIAATRPAVAPYRSMHSLITTTSESAKPKMDESDIISPDRIEYDVLDMPEQKSKGLVPIIPGVNLPWSHMPLFMIVLVFAAVLHEWGHAAASSLNGVKVNGFGLFLFAVYPGAFTEIDPASLKRSSAISQLMIFSGGIWHNLVLACFAYLLFAASPLLMTPFYATGVGVTVFDVDSRSGLYGPSGLVTGYVLDGIDDCPTKSVNEWRSCIHKISHRPDNGRCVNKTVFANALAENTIFGSDEIHCCAGFTNITHAHMCFQASFAVERHETTVARSLKDVLGNVQPRQEKMFDVVRQYSCLSAKMVTDQNICNTSNPCVDDEQNESVCVVPALFNGTRLVRISVANNHRSVLYVGNIAELLSFVSLRDSVARWGFIPFFSLELVELFPKYLFTLSLALGVLNSVPCYALDGQHITSALISLFAPNLNRRRSRQFTFFILLFGTLLLLMNILIGFGKFLFA